MWDSHTTTVVPCERDLSTAKSPCPPHPVTDGGAALNGKPTQGWSQRAGGHQVHGLWYPVLPHGFSTPPLRDGIGYFFSLGFCLFWWFSDYILK